MLGEHGLWWKSSMYYVYYVGYPPQLFDLRDDPDELHDLAAQAQHADRLRAFEQRLRMIVDPEEVDRRAKADQRQRIAAHGGVAKVLAGGVKIPYTPAPTEFGPAQVDAPESAHGEG
jgi:choline-sulfatase